MTELDPLGRPSEPTAPEPINTAAPPAPPAGDAPETPPQPLQDEPREMTEIPQVPPDEPRERTEGLAKSDTPEREPQVAPDEPGERTEGLAKSDTPEREPQVAPDEPGEPRKGWLKVVATVLAGALLLGAGIGFGYAIAPDDEAAAPVASQPEAQPAPISAAGDEPVAAVADALAPSVVQLERDLGLGSGVIYDSDGYILTAAHVVEDQSEVTVRLSNGQTLEGEVLGADDFTDIAVVKVDDEGLPAAQLAVGDELKVGQLAVAIGSPFGLEQTVTSGIISAVHRPIPVPVEGGTRARDMIQTDAPINPGNSGGALADRRGRVIGINDAIQTTSEGNQGVGFAVPIDIAAWVADKIVAGEDPVPAFLGIVGQTPATGQAGALVTEVQDDTPAADAGLRKGDLVVTFDGDSIQSMADLSARVLALEPGTSVTLIVRREGEQFEVDATLTELPSSP